MTADDTRIGDPVTPRSLADLRRLTPARVGLGRTGASLPTRALLDFTLDHARARDAVHAAFDAQALGRDLAALGLAVMSASSRAQTRGDYLKRPDLGRRLAATSQDALGRRAGPGCDVVLILGDGLSPTAVNVHAPALVRSLLPRLSGLAIGPAVVATSARVALGDEIGALLGARLAVMLIGERPGLSAPDSLGAYLTFGPRPGLTDADRNCVSNVHAGGLGYGEAAFKIGWLVRAGLSRGVTGVMLKDDSGLMPALPRY